MLKFYLDTPKCIFSWFS